MHTQLKGSFNLPTDRNGFDPKQIATQRNSSKGLCILLGNKNCELPLHLEKMISLGIYTGYLAPNLNNNTVHQPLVVVHRQRTFIDIRVIKPDANSWFKSGLCK